MDLFQRRRGGFHVSFSIIKRDKSVCDSSTTIDLALKHSIRISWMFSEKNISPKCKNGFRKSSSANNQPNDKLRSTNQASVWIELKYLLLLARLIGVEGPTMSLFANCVISNWSLFNYRMFADCGLTHEGWPAGTMGRLLYCFEATRLPYLIERIMITNDQQIDRWTFSGNIIDQFEGR